jgi:hypothetical protein
MLHVLGEVMQHRVLGRLSNACLARRLGCEPRNSLLGSKPLFTLNCHRLTPVHINH